MGMKGRCQCGEVRFEMPLDEPLKIYICHCLECRLQSASSYGLTAIFPVPSAPSDSSQSPSQDLDPPFPYLTPSAKSISVYTRQTSLNKSKNCYFCSKCGSRIYHHCPGEKFWTVKAGLLEGLSKEMMGKGVHIWAKRAVVEIPEGVERWEEEPDD